MSMSLDGFIAGPDDTPDEPLGRSGHRLHSWLGDGGGDSRTFRPSGVNGEVFDELLATGAVLVGRRTYEFAGRFDGVTHLHYRVNYAA